MLTALPLQPNVPGTKLHHPGLTSREVLDAVNLAGAAYSDDLSTLTARYLAPSSEFDYGLENWRPITSELLNYGLSAERLVNELVYQSSSYPTLGLLDTVFPGTAEAIVFANMATGDLGLAFRGTAGINDAFDWSPQGQVTHYWAFGELFAALDNFMVARGTTRLIVAGHSLGGAMTEIYMSLHPDDTLPGVSYEAVAVASPLASFASDNRVLNVGHVSDIVYSLIGIRNGNAVDNSHAVFDEILLGDDFNVGNQHSSGISYRHSTEILLQSQFYARTGRSSRVVFAMTNDTDELEEIVEDLFTDDDALVLGRNRPLTLADGTVLSADDYLVGGANDDYLEGFAGNDILRGDLVSLVAGGDDILAGGPGEDLFLGTPQELDGDTIVDLEIGDRIGILGATIDPSAISLSRRAISIEVPGAVFSSGDSTITISLQRALPAGARLKIIEETLDEGGSIIEVVREELGQDVAIVIDRSGSMSGAKLAGARQSAQVFIDLMQPGDGIAVTSFNTAATVHFPMAEIDAQRNVATSAKQAVARITSSGDTTIRAGLEAGLAQLEDASEGGTRAMIVLSDGVDTVHASPSALDFVRNSVPSDVVIYTIGYGTDVDAAELAALARERNGEYFFAAGPQDLARIYATISALVDDEQDLLTERGLIQPNQRLDREILVDGTATHLTAGVTWPGSDLDLALVSPSGAVISAAEASRRTDVSHIVGDTYEYLRVDFPEMGNWRVLVTAVEVDPRGEAYELTARIDSDLILSVIDPIEYSLTNSLPLAVDLDGDIVGPVEVTAHVLKPSVPIYINGAANVTIPDSGSTSTRVEVRTDAVIRDVNVGVNIQHPYVADLQLTLISPHGERIALVADQGGSGNDFAGTIFDDEAAESITEGSAPFAGRFRPETPLHVVDGLNARGHWTLLIEDDASSDVGVLLNWWLEITPQSSDVAPQVYHLYDDGRHGDQFANDQIFGLGDLRLDGPAGVYEVVVTASGQSASGGAFHRQTTVQIDRISGNTLVTDNDGQLLVADVFTGATRRVGQFQTPLNDIAVDPYDGRLFAVGADQRLYRIDLGNSSRATSIVPMGSLVGGPFHTLAFRHDGALFASNGSSIFRVDAATATTHWVANMPPGVRVSGDVVFDRQGRLLVSTSSRQLYRFDFDSARWTHIGETGNATFAALMVTGGQLIGMTSDGWGYLIDQQSGAARRILRASGDVAETITGGTALRTPYQTIRGRSDTGEWQQLERDGETLLTRSLGVWSNEANWRDIGAGDFNGDGRQDVVGRTAGGGWWVGLSDPATGELFSERWALWSTAVDWLDVSTGDFNGDGRDDIVGRTAQGGWWVGLSTGDSFQSHFWGRWSPQLDWRNVQVGDFDGDGVSDVIGQLPTGTWWVARSNRSGFTSTAWGRWSPNVDWRDIQLGDLNGDGRDDLIGRTNNGVWWASVSRGDRFDIQAWGNWSTQIAWSHIMVADFNGDGRDDIAGRTPLGRWWVSFSTGNSFHTVAWGQSHHAMTSRAPIAMDFSGDGRADFISQADDGAWWLSVATAVGFVHERLTPLASMFLSRDITVIDVVR